MLVVYLDVPVISPPPFTGGREVVFLREWEVKDPWVLHIVSKSAGSLWILCKSCMPGIRCRMVIGAEATGLCCSWSVLCKAPWGGMLGEHFSFSE